ncbi:hypothetical protein [Thermococcus sp. Bubb.Bath]|uniref:hypothetical protein n=1 Tax=Thermococcus sp. Bubb.Bath TaxID=1638242 RepID=UPI00143C96F2|nr:hypothetical protein [Thermococcus sp. Bubb.Bath]NJF25368.1 hypothetical protein [Thermococcus sp. Bubb.Bath]
MKAVPDSSRDIYREVLTIGRDIPDPYIRTITLARIAYEMKKAGHPAYKTALRFTFSSIEGIEDPILVIKAMVEISKYLHAASMGDMAKNVLHQAYEGSEVLPEPIRDSLLSEITLQAIAIGQVDDAAFYAASIKNPEKRDDVFLAIIKLFLREGNLRRAKNLLDAISSPDVKSQAAVEILREHLKREEFATALSLLPHIENAYWLETAMEEIGRKLRKSGVHPGTYEKFINAAKELSERMGRNLVTSFLSGLIQEDEVGFMAEVINSLPSEDRLDVARHIVKLVLNNPGKLRDLLTSLNMDAGDFDELAKFTMDLLLEEKPRESYIPLVKWIGEKTEDETVLVKTATYLAKLGELEGATLLAKPIEDPYLRSLAFGAVALEKLKRGDIDGAIDAAREAHDREWGSWLMGEILIRVLRMASGEREETELQESARKHKELRKGLGH